MAPGYKRPVTRYDEATGEFDYFESLTEAAKAVAWELPKPKAEVVAIGKEIINSINTGYPRHNSKWMFQSEDKPLIMRIKLRGADKDQLYTYKDFMEAASDVWQEYRVKSITANITSCTKGRSKTAYGYQWRYADEI